MGSWLHGEEKRQILGGYSWEFLVGVNLVPRAFPLKTHFLREKPWGRGWVGVWRPVLQILTLFQTEKCHFSTLFRPHDL